MEDSIALQLACSAHGLEDVPRVLSTYEEARMVETIKTQKAARTSRDWFENTERYANQHPLQFNFNLMTRSKRITYENLRLRDPKLVERVSRWWGESQGPESEASAAALPPMFSPLRLRDLKLENRVVVSPMCQYSAVDGLVDEWHMVHLGSRAVGGAGLLLTEMTDVSSQGRITRGCAGLWSEQQASAWKRIVDFVHSNTPARIGVQLAHAGRKGSCRLPWNDGQPLSGEDSWETLAPSPLPFGPGWPTPRAMERADMEAVRDQFVRSTELALAAGFDLIELHLAHGYLLSSFISPASNQRTDEYGGSLENRLRFPLEVFDAMRSAWPETRPMAARISATDWLPGDLGLTADDAVAIASALQEHGCDLVDVSSGGNTPESEPEFGRMYHVPFAERIKHEVGITVCVVGAIQGHDHVNTVLAAGRADLCALARPHLLNPYLTLEAAVEYEHVGNWWPKQYQPARPEPPAS